MQCSIYDLLYVVEKNGYYCSLLGVSDQSRSATSVAELLQGLETEEVVSLTSTLLSCCGSKHGIIRRCEHVCRSW